AGADAADPATAGADAHKRDYTAALGGASLRRARLGVLRYVMADLGPEESALFARTLDALRAAGAEVVEIDGFSPPDSFGSNELLVLETELKAGLNGYLATTDPAKVKTRTLAEVIAFDRATPRETALFGQELFEKAQATGGLADPAYIKAQAENRRFAQGAINRLLAERRLDALIAPTTTPAWRTDVVLGDHDVSEGATPLAAVAGYPHLTVPMGQVKGLPVGLSFIGGAWREAELLRLGAAFEALARARQAPGYRASVETEAAVAPLLAPER
ncbi:MAG: amidase, partial [Caulobacteraceae bacterium]|nr:amidase [Caulobacter sp.]